MKKLTITKYSAGFALALMLAACGGGGGGSGTPTSTTGSGGGSTTPPTAAAQLSGKAIDGYLAGATVCFDNGQGACDTTLPTSTTDANGNYSLPDTGTYLGKTLLVLVTPTTKDLSRPGYAFPASFTLSQIVTASGAQNISPFSTLISAQMETGLSQQQATAAVSAMLGGIDPNADYIASGNSSALTTATAIVDKLTSLASNGVVDAATVRNAANAMVAAGTPDVTADQVAAQASKPVYAGVDASSVLSQSTYSLDGYLPYFASYNSSPVQSIVQDIRTISNGTIVTAQQELASNTWQPVTNGKYENMYGAYEMKTDASWSAFVPVSTYRAPLPVSVNGAVLSGTDATTGISYTYEFRQADLSGQTLATAVPMNYSAFVNLWTAPALVNTTFSSGTKAYLGLLSYTADQVILPVWTPACDNPTIVNGQVCDGSQPAVNEDGVISLITGDPTVTYTAVQQVVGQSLEGRSGGFGMTLTADNKVTAQTWVNGNPQVAQIGTWSVYSRNSNVLVLDIPVANLAQLGTDPLLSPVNDGAKLVVALRNGHLRMGWLYPSTYAQRTYQFQGALNAQLLAGVQAATAPQ